MIVTFVAFLVVIFFYALGFFYLFRNGAIRDTVESLFLANVNHIVHDINEIKRNDFILQQKEMKVQQRAILDLLHKNRINPKALLGNQNNLEPFNRLIGSGTVYQKQQHQKLNNNA